MRVVGKWFPCLAQPISSYFLPLSCWVERVRAAREVSGSQPPQATTATPKVLAHLHTARVVVCEFFPVWVPLNCRWWKHKPGDQFCFSSCGWWCNSHGPVYCTAQSSSLQQSNFLFSRCYKSRIGCLNDVLLQFSFCFLNVLLDLSVHVQKPLLNTSNYQSALTGFETVSIGMAADFF